MSAYRSAPVFAGVLVLAACASRTEPEAAPPPPDPPAPESAAPTTPETAVAPPAAVEPSLPAPAYAPSGVKEDFRKLREAKEERKSARTMDAKKAADAAFKALKSDLSSRWTPDRVPAQEAHYLAHILDECGRSAEAASESRRWLAVAPPDSVNLASTTMLLITCLAESGDAEGAEAELRAAAEGILADRPRDRANLVSALALTAQAQGDLERAVRLFEEAAFAADGDVECVLLASEIAQRLGGPEEAVRIARRASEFFQSIEYGSRSDRVRQLVEALGLLGKPAPGFEGVSWWKGAGGPVSREDLGGRVTVVFSWNMQSVWNRFFFERLNTLEKEYRDRGVRVIGLSRLARFDPMKMATREELTDEEELVFLDMWKNQYGVTYPLGVCAYQSETLLRDWAIHVVPQWVVVGKDGNVFAVCSGKDAERFAALRDLVDRALRQ